MLYAGCGGEHHEFARAYEREYAGADDVHLHAAQTWLVRLISECIIEQKRLLETPT